MISFRGIFHNTDKWFWQKNLFSTNFLLMAASVYRNRLSDFDGLFYLHKPSNKNRYLQHFTTSFVGINSSCSYCYAAEINDKRSILPLTLLANGMVTSTKYFIIKKGTKEVRLCSTSTNARNLTRHFRVSSFSFNSRLDVKFSPVKLNWAAEKLTKSRKR